MTTVEYLLRTVRESERMQGWQDAFSKLREEFTKDFSKSQSVTEIAPLETDDTFEM